MLYPCLRDFYGVLRLQAARSMVQSRENFLPTTSDPLISPLWGSVKNVTQKITQIRRFPNSVQPEKKQFWYLKPLRWPSFRDFHATSDALDHVSSYDVQSVMLKGSYQDKLLLLCCVTSQEMMHLQYRQNLTKFDNCWTRKCQESRFSRSSV